MTTPINGFPVAAMSDVANIVTNVDELTDALDLVGVPRFNLLSERNAAIPSPSDGMVCYVTQTEEMYLRKNSAWCSMVPRTKTKSSDQNAGNTNYRNDNELFLSVEANSRYLGEMILAYTSALSDGDLKFSFSGPSGYTVQGVNVDALDVAAVNNGLSVFLDSALDLTGTFNVGGVGPTNLVGVRVKLMITTSSTAGTFTVRWAQSSSSATLTIVNEGSSLELSKIP